MTQGSPTTGELVAKADELVDAIRADYDAAIARIATLERELEEARALNNKYAWERDKAREERDAAERRSEAFWKPQVENANRYLAFVARWAWRDGKHLSDEERLSSIKFYPPIKAIHDRAAIQLEESKP